MKVFALPILYVALSASTALGQVPVMLPEFQVSTTPPGFDYGVDSADSVAIGDDGRFIVTWSNPYGANSGCLQRSYNPFGNAESLPAPVSSAGSGWLSDVARDASGRYVIVWMGGDDKIWGRRFDSDGAPIGDDFQVNTSSTPISSPHVASDPAGNMVVAWTTSGAAGGDVMARLFDSHGAPRGDEFPVNAFTSGDQVASGAAMAPDGHFVLSWGGDGTLGNGVFVRIFDSAGAAITGDVQLNTVPVVSQPDVSIDSAGQIVVVWLEQNVVGRRLDPTGVPSGPVFPISGAAYTNPRVASNAAGNFLVTWGSPEIAARFYDPSGAAVGPEFQVAQGYDYDHWSEGARASVADNGSFVVAWSRVRCQGYPCGPLFNAEARRSGVRALGVWIPTGNGVLEPGESVVVGTAWNNDSSDNVPLAGTASAFSGPPGATYTLGDATADYGTIPAGQGTNCSASGNCYGVSVSAPAVRPVQHWDARLQEALSIGVPKTWNVHIGESFPDVPTDSLFYKSIETVFHNGVTAGCFGGGYCPADPITRAQMAAFLLKSKFGSAHVPPPCTGTVFADVTCTGSPFDPWIEELAALSVTAGCGGNLYCPGDSVTREQMAVLLLKTLEGSGYVPPSCTGVFDDVPCTPGQGFSDWIEELSDRGITGGCSAAPALYCPTSPSNRGQMAAFLTRTFGLVLYGG